MRKMITATLLMLVLLCGILPAGAQETAEYPWLEPDVETMVEFSKSGELRYFRYVPEFTESYTFCCAIPKFAKYAFGYLYDEEMNLLAKDESTSFSITWTLEAGKTYYLATRYWVGNLGPYPILLRTNHEFTSAVTKEASCRENGEITYSCIYCDETYMETFPPVHQISDGACTVCGEAFVAGGPCGDRLNWTLSPEGKLTILGSGSMWDFTWFAVPQMPIPSDQEEPTPPWMEYREEIVSVELSPDMTDLGNYAFYGLTALETIAIPEGVTDLGDGTFGYNTALWEISLPGSVKSGGFCFTGCHALSQITFGGARPSFWDDTLTDGADGLTIFYHSAAEGWDLAKERWNLPRDTQWCDLDSMMDPGSFAFDEDAYTIGTGQRIVLSTNADPATFHLLQWTAEGGRSIALSPGGAVMGLRPGTVTVTASTPDGVYKASCRVTVTESAYPVCGSHALEGGGSANLSRNDYEVYDSVNNSYLRQNGDGTMEKVQYISGTGVVISHYSKDLELLRQQTIPAELEIFGGFFAGEQYNFLLFGQENRQESDELNVVRIVKYSKDWERLGDCSLRSIITVEPFRAGTSDWDERDGLVYLHTCHTMYDIGDGKNHQANMTFVLDQETMEVRDSCFLIMNIDHGYVSHSFSQRIRTNDTYVFRADHGDGHLRSIVLTRALAEGPVTDVRYVELLPIQGEEGENATGASLGGMELSADNCLAVGNSVDQSDPDTYSPTGQRNIFLSVTSQQSLRTKVIWLTDYSGNNTQVRTPQLVKVAEELFLILWEEATGSTVRTMLVMADGAGNLLFEPFDTDLRLSDCQPVCGDDNLVRWFVTDRGNTTLYELSWMQLLVDRMHASILLGHDPNPFTDVKEDDYFFEPVLWAVENGITSGTGAGQFSPGQTCTRAQVVTFLWRAMGKPEPEQTENPFTDVKPSDYFYDAVLWAVENGITSGTGGGKFSPSNPCTRDQVVTFLWRAMGKPAPEKTENPFTDVSEGAYYYEPVLWAVENGITSGTSATTFAPSNPCTRGQVVTFLYRAMGAQ